MSADLVSGWERAGDVQKSGAGGQGTGTAPSSLAEEQRDLTRARIRRAAMEVVARRGFDATVDEIARVSGVSPRTIFRHYVSHDRLIAETVRDMFEACGRYPDVGSPRLHRRPRLLDRRLASAGRRLTSTAGSRLWPSTIHTRMSEVFGDRLLGHLCPTAAGSEALAEVAEPCQAYRRRDGLHGRPRLALRRRGGTLPRT